MVAISDSLDSAIEVNSISFLVASGDRVMLDHLDIFMGYSELDDLGMNFDDNYVPGSKTLVFEDDNLIIDSPGSGQWLTLDLDVPFWYSGQQNLVLEFRWPGGSQEIDIWGWYPTANHTVFAPDWQASQGTPMMESLLFRLNGTLALEANTFGAIKATLGR